MEQIGQEVKVNKMWMSAQKEAQREKERVTATRLTPRSLHARPRAFAPRPQAFPFLQAFESGDCDPYFMDSAEFHEAVRLHACGDVVRANMTGRNAGLPCRAPDPARKSDDIWYTICATWYYDEIYMNVQDISRN
jgi:hypothetical protein